MRKRRLEHKILIPRKQIWGPVRCKCKSGESRKKWLYFYLKKIVWRTQNFKGESLYFYCLPYFNFKILIISNPDNGPIIDGHGFKFRGGVSSDFWQNPWGGRQCFPGVNALLGGRGPYFDFYCIFINKFFEKLPGRSSFITPFHLTPLCAFMGLM